ncbi:MAG: pseudoazurin [Devosia sp. 67-54]|uniref:pseudoazurin n=1 Tax=unclassified Devosia TaxID=196773 RepID=UPI0009595EE1|nr:MULTISPECIES: pseudoazurin [unclassified Devosia]MBN9304494.1 pseudoazurin [Devosia sp.]OJX15504.1 MAG: pseudoazurin [Devosia sp. 67-54]
MVRTIISALVLLAASTALAGAAEFEVDMLNKGPDGAMVFEPPLTRVAVGDTVHFVAKDKGHDAQTIPGMLPDGATPIKGQISQDVTVTFTVPGVYGVRCVPHFGLGMVALVLVGDAPPANLAAAKAVNVPPLAKKRLDPLWAQIQ